MADRMTFPATFKEFAEQYKIVDKEEVYTNGIELIPIFRVEQWLDNANADVATDFFEEFEALVTQKDMPITTMALLATKEYADFKKKWAKL